MVISQIRTRSQAHGWHSFPQTAARCLLYVSCAAGSLFSASSTAAGLMLPLSLLLLVASVLPLCAATFPAQLTPPEHLLARPTVFPRAASESQSSSSSSHSSSTSTSHSTSNTPSSTSTKPTTTSTPTIITTTTKVTTATATVTAKPTSANTTALHPYTQSFPPKTLKPPKGQQNVSISARDPRVLYGQGNWQATIDTTCGEDSALTSSQGAQMQFQFTGEC